MKWWWLAPAAVATAAAGILLGWVVDVTPDFDTPESDPAFREILVGTPASVLAAGEPWQPTDRLTQKQTYTTADPLAVRVVSSEPLERHIQLTVRLLKQDGSVEALRPETITVTGGTGGFCCWQVETPGKYSLQIFQGDSAPFVLPLTVVKARHSNKSPLQL